MTTTPNQALDVLIARHGLHVCQNHAEISELYFHLLGLKFEYGGKQLVEINNKKWKEMLK